MMEWGDWNGLEGKLGEVVDMREDLSDLRMKAIDLYGHPSDVGTQLVLACCALTDVEFHLKRVIEFRKAEEERNGEASAVC